jgi:hypothetical protein
VRNPITVLQGRSSCGTVPFGGLALRPKGGEPSLSGGYVGIGEPAAATASAPQDAQRHFLDQEARKQRAVLALPGAVVDEGPRTRS